jgi:hypothetical protein
MGNCLLIVLLLALELASCGGVPTEVTHRTPIEDQVPSKPAQSTEGVLQSPFPSAGPRQIPTPASSPRPSASPTGSGLGVCARPERISTAADVPGHLVVFKGSSLLDYDLAASTHRTIGQMSRVAALADGNFAASLDRTLFAFIDSETDETGYRTQSRRLRLTNASAPQIIGWSENWQWLAGWVEGDRITLLLPSRGDGTVTMLDPLTGISEDVHLPIGRACSRMSSRPTPVLVSPAMTAMTYLADADPYTCDWVVASAASGEVYWSGFSVEWPRWSPDGHSVAITHEEELLRQSLVTVSDQGIIRTLTSPSRPSENPIDIVVAPSWSPDSTRIAVWAGVTEQFDTVESFSLSIINAETAALTQFCLETASIPFYEPPVWSPDGRWLAVHTYTPTNGYPSYEEHLIILDTVEERAFTLESDMIPLSWLSPQ